MGLWRYAVRPRWLAPAMVAVLAGVPVTVASDGLHGDLTTPAPLGLAGDVSLSTVDGVLTFSPATGGAASIDVQAGRGTLHVWRWNTTRVEAGIVAHSSDAVFEELIFPIEDLDQIRVDPGPDASVTMATLLGTLSVHTASADAVQAAEAHASVDPLVRARVAAPGIPYVHHLEDVTALTLRDGGVFAGQGRLRLAFWDAYVTLATEDAQRTWLAGESFQGPSARAAPGVTLQKQVVWADLEASDVSLRTPGATLVFGRFDSIRVDGVAAVKGAAGELSLPHETLNLAGDDLSLDGDLQFVPRHVRGGVAHAEGLDSGVLPYRRSAWGVSGNVRSVAVDDGPAFSPSADTAQVPPVALGAGLIVAGIGLARLLLGVFAAVVARTRATPMRGGTRTRVLQTVTSHPGWDAARVADAAGVSTSTAKYHLRILDAAGLIATQRDGRTIRYFENHGTWDRDGAIVALIHHGRASRVAHAIIHAPGLDQAFLSATTGLPRSTVSFHIQRLLQAGAVREERYGGQNVKHYHPTIRLHGVMSRLQRSETEARNTTTAGV